MNLRELKVGDEVWIGSYDRLRQGAEPEGAYHVVTKIGRKYIYVGEGWREQRFELDSEWSAVYESEAEWREQLATEDAWRAFCRKVGVVRQPEGLTRDKIRQAEELLGLTD